MSDTPRTDAVISEGAADDIRLSRDDFAHYSAGAGRLASHARDLERELAEAKHSLACARQDVTAHREAHQQAARERDAKFWECPECMFKFDAFHRNQDGTYTCPVCEEGKRVPYAELTLQELRNIVNAKRFDREVFDDDTEFADWATSRARHTIRKVEERTVVGVALGWKPVAELPEDGTPALGFWAPVEGPVSSHHYSVVLYLRGIWRNHEDEDDHYAAPTHWMPLPKEPT